MEEEEEGSEVAVEVVALEVATGVAASVVAVEDLEAAVEVVALEVVSEVGMTLAEEDVVVSEEASG